MCFFPRTVNHFVALTTRSLWFYGRITDTAITTAAANATTCASPPGCSATAGASAATAGSIDVWNWCVALPLLFLRSGVKQIVWCVCVNKTVDFGTTMSLVGVYRSSTGEVEIRTDETVRSCCVLALPLRRRSDRTWFMHCRAHDLSRPSSRLQQPKEF